MSLAAQPDPDSKPAKPTLDQPLAGGHPAQPDSKPAAPSSDRRQRHPDILIAGAGIIGLALALELDRRGARVTVLEAGQALRQASTAAAGMLAVDDPHNPPALLPLSQLSATLYPAFLRRIQALSGVAVPFQTHTTIQYLPDGRSTTLAEHSLDPRQLAAALLAAVRATRINLREHTPLQSAGGPRGTHVFTTGGQPLAPNLVVFATGAWTDLNSSVNPLDLHRRPLISPRKGQMLRVALPPSLRNLREVHRSKHVYIVPRTQGPQAGSALIGATVEDAGFETSTDAPSLTHLRALASEFFPTLADEHTAPQVEAWAGLRPATPDHLPLLGRLPDRFDRPAQGPAELLAIGHFRNGILLAPATAAVLADLIENKPAALDLSPFSPLRPF